MGMTIDVNIGGINAMFDALEADVQKAVRPAAYAATKVIYDAVKVNVGKLGKKTGNLDKAIYHVFAESKSGPGRATYEISWNASKAPHGHLVEFGHIQRYAVHLGKDGKWYTVVRPSMRGKPKPKRRASQAAKDAYYVLRKGGPQQIAAQPFMRPAIYKTGEAIAAAEKRFFEVLGQK